MSPHSLFSVTSSQSTLLYLIFSIASISPTLSSSLDHLRSLSPAQVANITAQQFIHSYDAYKKYALGCDALYPQAKGCHNYYTYSNMWTPIDALDTMYLMGLDDLVTETMHLLCSTPSKFTFLTDQNVVVFDYFLRSLGGLLSAYHFINDSCLYDLALEVSNAIYPIFNEVNPSLSGLPWRKLNLKTGEIDTTAADTSPAEAGTHSLEYGIMSVISGDLKYWNASINAMRILYEAKSKELDLIGIGILLNETSNPQSPQFFRDSTASISSGIDSYYEYIVKCWALFDNEECKYWWLNGINASIIENLSYYNKKNGNDLLWFKHVDMHTGEDRSLSYDLYSPFYSSVLSLTSVLADNEYNLELAKLNQESNWWLWNINDIEPYVYDFGNDYVSVASYNLNPENFESNYYLYMVTNDSVYYDRALVYLDDLMTYCKCNGIYNASDPSATNCVGYTGMKNVMSKERSNSQPSYWFAESLKYLYLTFMRNEPNNPLPFEDYVFNTEAHPYPKTWGRKLKDMIPSFVTGQPTAGPTKSPVKSEKTVSPSSASPTTIVPSTMAPTNTGVLTSVSATMNVTTDSDNSGFETDSKDVMIVLIAVCCALIFGAGVGYYYFVRRKRSMQTQNANFQMLNSDGATSIN